MYKILAKLPFKSNYVHYLPSCHSTNEVAQDLVQAGAGEGEVVITDHQLAGKGQQGNTWEAAPGQNLTLSLILKPVFLQPNEQFFITVAVSLAIRAMLETHLPGPVHVKWPNDIYYKDRKIAGLLIENVLRGNKFDTCIVGLGLNVNQTTFSQGLRATSMQLATGESFVLNVIFNQLLEELAGFYFGLKDRDERERFFADYHQALLGMGEERLFKAGEQEFTGIISGTDAYGRLQIETASGRRIFQHKEVEMLF